MLMIQAVDSLEPGCQSPLGLRRERKVDEKAVSSKKFRKRLVCYLGF